MQCSVHVTSLPTPELIGPTIFSDHRFSSFLPASDQQLFLSPLQNGCRKEDEEVRSGSSCSDEINSTTANPPPGEANDQSPRRTTQERA